MLRITLLGWASSGECKHTLIGFVRAGVGDVLVPKQVPWCAQAVCAPIPSRSAAV